MENDVALIAIGVIALIMISIPDWIEEVKGVIDERKNRSK